MRSRRASSSKSRWMFCIRRPAEELDAITQAEGADECGEPFGFGRGGRADKDELRHDLAWYERDRVEKHVPTLTLFHLADEKPEGLLRQRAVLFVACAGGHASRIIHDERNVARVQAERLGDRHIVF